MSVLFFEDLCTLPYSPANIVGDKSHIFYYECGGAAHLANVSPRPLPNEADGTIPLQSILGAIRDSNIHFPITRLVALENTHAFCGGRVLPEGYIQSVSNVLKDKNIKLHIDGARIWNAAVAAGRQVSEVVAGADSVSVCMSKGLGAPIGSLLVGPADFIRRARHVRKSLGGGMRQVGVLGAPCMVALDDFEAGLICQQDHKHARRIAEALASDDISAFSVDTQLVETNIILVFLSDGVRVPVAEVCSMLKQHRVLVAPRDSNSIRVVTHRDLSSEAIDGLIDAFRAVSRSIVA